jgi:hypothetical protein
MDTPETVTSEPEFVIGTAKAVADEAFLCLNVRFT